MSNTELLVKLRGLHEQLASINNNLDTLQQIDEETIDALGDLVSDISQVVDHARSAADRETQSSDHQHVADRIRKFESNHPHVTNFLSQLTDLLAMIGI